MEVNLRCEPGVICWNSSEIQKCANDIVAREAILSGSPNLNIIPGKIACKGAIQNKWGNGTFCGAEVTETKVEIAGI